MRILGIEVSASLLTQWRRWLAPSVQPFFAPADSFDIPSSTVNEETPESRDTFRTWKMGRELDAVWLTEEAFLALEKQTRARLVRTQVTLGRGAVPAVRAWADVLDPRVLRAQADGHRFVWWASLLAGDDGTIISRVVSEDRRPSRHDEVPETTWRRCSTVIPGVRTLAGTFPNGSGPNCFGTVMAACGESEVIDAWVHGSPVEEWLEEKTRPGGDDHSPGTVIVWRDSGGVAQHAAVTIGDGWALEKPSQEWHSPRVVLPVRELINANRVRGQRMQRRKLIVA